MKSQLLYFLCFVTMCFGCSKQGGEPAPDPVPDDLGKAYNTVILADRPVGFWLLNKDDLNDASTRKHHGTWHGQKSVYRKMPNGEDAIVFDGSTSYYEIPDADHLEVSNKGVLTIEAWMMPTVYDFVMVEKDKDYVHWMGKGAAGQHSWVARMYNRNSWRENRPQRISGYAFNLAGGLGAGSYFQDVIATGTWIHYVLVINANEKSTKFPVGYTKLYRDGVLRDQDDLSAYDIVPGNGNAPTRIGTRDMGSFFQGAIGKVAIYDYELTADKIMSHYKAMK